MKRRLTLILGGARSGKSHYAEQLAAQHGSVLFVATAEALDDEMRLRIAHHRASRPAHWRTLEAPMQVGAAIATQPNAEAIVLDCLTLLVSNVLLAQGSTASEAQVQAAVDAEIDALLATYLEQAAHWIVVSNEVGMGVVPATPLGRLYRDVLGRTNQRLARHASRVILMVAGLPMRLHPTEDA